MYICTYFFYSACTMCAALSVAWKHPISHSRDHVRRSWSRGWIDPSIKVTRRNIHGREGVYICLGQGLVESYVQYIGSTEIRKLLIFLSLIVFLTYPAFCRSISHHSQCRKTNWWGLYYRLPALSASVQTIFKYKWSCILRTSGYMYVQYRGGSVK